MNCWRICDVLVKNFVKKLFVSMINQWAKCQCLVRCVLGSPASCICGGTHSGVHDLPPSRSQTTQVRCISAWLRRLRGIRLIETAAVDHMLSTREVCTAAWNTTRAVWWHDHSPSAGRWWWLQAQSAVFLALCRGMVVATLLASHACLTTGRWFPRT